MRESVDLFLLIKKGDKKAFEEFFRMLYSKLCHFAYKYLNDKKQAEDIVQDVFFTLWMKRKQIKINQNIESYVYTSVKNQCLMFIQHQKIKSKYIEYIKINREPKKENGEAVLEYKELNEKINIILDSLPEKMREIFILSRYEGLKYSEIAEKMSVSVKTVEANITKALKIFRKKLGGYMELNHNQMI